VPRRTADQEPIRSPSGWRFHPRCRYATDICRAERPVLTDYGNAHLAACHHPIGGAASTTRGD